MDIMYKNKQNHNPMKTITPLSLTLLLFVTTNCTNHVKSGSKSNVIKAYGDEIKISITKDSIQTNYTFYGQISMKEKLNDKTIFFKDSVLMPDGKIVYGPDTLHLTK